MAKTKRVYFCNSCGAEFSKWTGQCMECGKWGTLVEEKVVVTKSSKGVSLVDSSMQVRPVAISEVQRGDVTRRRSCFEELDRVLGGGVVSGSLILLGGEPGIGKSTLSLQMVLHSEGLKSLYVSGEESAQQIKLRADRIGIRNDSCVIYAETNLERILGELHNNSYDMVIIDSIQTIYTEEIESVTGGVSQIRECASRLLKYAKESGVPIFLIGHITKDGTIAGPKILEHIVDVVLQFEGDSNNSYRILRGIKNRFGAANELGVFEMVATGLKEVHNPSEVMLNRHDEEISGVAVGVMLEGGRSYMLEVESLVASVAFGNPQRVTTGFDQRRLNMLLAVVEKRLGYKMISKDTFVNIAGGLKVQDPGLDLSVMASILSSLLDIAIPSSVCFCGEIGLSGELRPASKSEKRIQEALRLGFETIVCSSYARSEVLDKISGIKIVYISRVESFVRDFLAKL